MVIIVKYYRIMEFSDTEYEHVAAKIFDGCQQERIPTSEVMQSIAPYIGSNRSEYILLRDTLDPHKEDRKINQAGLKLALLQWTESLKPVKDLCIMEDLSKTISLDTPEKLLYTTTSYSSGMSSGAYKDRILELQNEVAEKEHLVGRLRTQLDLAAHHTQQHEDALSAIISERDQLRLKIHSDQQSNASLVSLKEEYEYLLETLNTFREKSQNLKDNLDILKKENNHLNTKIKDLDNEKHSLTQILFRTKEEKNKAVELLSEAQCDIEMLKTECQQFTDRIQHQQKSIHDLTTMKYSLEIELQNTINKSVHSKKEQHSFGSDKSEPEIDPLLTNLELGDNNTLEALSEPSDSDVLQVNETQCNDVTRYVSGDHLLTSTPRNEMSLMQELYQVQSPSIGNSYSCFKSDLQGIDFNDDCGEASNLNELESVSNDTNTFEDSCNEETYVIRKCKKHKNNNNDESNEKLKYLEEQLLTQKNNNETLIEKLNENTTEIVEMRNIINGLKMKMVEMKAHEILLNFRSHSVSNSIKEARVQIEFLQCISHERASWLGMQVLPSISSSRNLLDNETQTDYCPDCCGQIMDFPKTISRLDANLHSQTTSTCWTFCSRVFGKVLFWGTIICFSMACLHLYNTMKYSSVVRRGSHVRFFPWKWITINELISSIFDFRHQGPVPI